MRVSVLMRTAVASVAALASATPLDARDISIWVTDGGFIPKNSTVAAGDHVRFVSRGRSPHQISKASGPDGGDLRPEVLDEPGRSVLVTLTSPGHYVYVDRLLRPTREFRVTVRQR
jgi:plastocyanin